MDFELSKAMKGQPVVETSEEVGQKTAAAKVSGEEPKESCWAGWREIIIQPNAGASLG